MLHIISVLHKGIEGKLLEQDMVQRICGQFDPAIPATWRQFCILITPYIERETMLQLNGFRTVFDIFRSKHLITLGYYERLTKIVGDIHAPCGRLMTRMQEKIEQKLDETGMLKIFFLSNCPVTLW